LVEIVKYDNRYLRIKVALASPDPCTLCTLVDRTLNNAIIGHQNSPKDVQRMVIINALSGIRLGLLSGVISLN